MLMPCWRACGKGSERENRHRLYNALFRPDMAVELTAVVAMVMAAYFVIGPYWQHGQSLAYVYGPPIANMNFVITFPPIAQTHHPLPQRGEAWEGSFKGLRRVWISFGTVGPLEDVGFGRRPFSSRNEGEIYREVTPRMLPSQFEAPTINWVRA
jgi:hypothetical protein